MEVVLRIAVHHIPINYQAAVHQVVITINRQRDSEYADGVDDAMDEFDEDW